LHDKKLLDLVGRVKVIHSPDADRVENEFNLCELELVLKNGQRKNVRVEYHRGHWKNPMTDAEMEEKFRLLARRQLPAPRIDALLKQLWALEEVNNIGALVELTRV
jgi:2-methylcitrate dehydratase